MAGFVFTLEPLLKARLRAEEDAQRALAELQRRRLALEDDLRRRQGEISQRKGALRGGLVGRLDMRDLRRGAASALHSVRKAQQTVLALAGVTQRVDEARKRLAEATRRRRAIELLRERRYRSWKAEQDRAETAALDELATARWRAPDSAGAGLAGEAGRHAPSAARKTLAPGLPPQHGAGRGQHP